LEQRFRLTGFLCDIDRTDVNQATSGKQMGVAQHRNSAGVARRRALLENSEEGSLTWPHYAEAEQNNLQH
jgi:hypothetical protein